MKLTGNPSTTVFDCVGIGETMVQLAPPVGGSLLESDSLTVRIAGAESTVVSYLAMLGHSAAWVSAVGDDPFGARVVAELEAKQVDVSHVKRDPSRPTGVFFKDLLPSRERSVYYYRAQSAASAMSVEIAESPALKGARIIHLSGITSAISLPCRVLVDRILDVPAADRGILSFDVNYRQLLWTAGEAAGILLAQARRADIVFVGRDEAEQLWGTMDAAAIRRLLPEPARVVVKDADVGATVFHHDDEPTFVGAPAIVVVEPVGAGDSFAAGYLHGALLGRDEATRLAYGHALAGSALQVIGDIGPIPVGMMA